MDDYVCHCTVHAWDGVSDITAKPTVFVKANSTDEAMKKAEIHLKEKYSRNKCTLNSAEFSLVKKI